MSRPRAAIVVTGSELVRGERTDRNGPFYAREALALGLVPERIAIVGTMPSISSRRAPLRSRSRHLPRLGGLGPTHDDRTVELVARVAGAELHVDEALERHIEGVSRAVAERLRRPYADFEGGVTKQATVPDGAIVIGVAGTAPGLALDDGDCVFDRRCPGRRQSCGVSGARRSRAPRFRLCSRERHRPAGASPRFFGASESAVARALAEAGGDGNGSIATICARDFEIHVDLVVEPGADDRADELARALREPLERYLFSEDERTIAELVLARCRERGLRLATAESCTGGLIAARLTDVPGSSDVLAGGIVAYANDVKTEALGVPGPLIAAHGAVSAEVAAAMALGVRERLGVDVGIAATGVAGPGGGSEAKPVGLVQLHVSTPDAERGDEFSFPGDREAIRTRATVAALHLARRALES